MRSERQTQKRETEREAGKEQDNLSISNALGGKKANHNYTVPMSKLKESSVMKIITFIQIAQSLCLKQSTILLKYKGLPTTR